MTQDSTSNINNPAPLWYRRLSNALIIFIIPAIAGLVQAWGFEEKITQRSLLLLTFIPALVKGVGTLMGSNEVYTPINTEINKN